MYAGKHVYTITTNDVGQSVLHYTECETCRRQNTIYIPSLMGQILPIDIGKQIFKVGNIYQVESNEQRDCRLLREESKKSSNDKSIKE